MASAPKERNVVSHPLLHFSNKSQSINNWTERSSQGAFIQCANSSLLSSATGANPPAEAPKESPPTTTEPTEAPQEPKYSKLKAFHQEYVQKLEAQPDPGPLDVHPQEEQRIECITVTKVQPYYNGKHAPCNLFGLVISEKRSTWGPTPASMLQAEELAYVICVLCWRPAHSKLASLHGLHFRGWVRLMMMWRSMILYKRQPEKIVNPEGLIFHRHWPLGIPLPFVYFLITKSPKYVLSYFFLGLFLESFALKTI